MYLPRADFESGHSNVCTVCSRATTKGGSSFPGDLILALHFSCFSASFTVGKGFIVLSMLRINAQTIQNGKWVILLTILPCQVRPGAFSPPATCSPRQPQDDSGEKEEEEEKDSE